MTIECVTLATNHFFPGNPIAAQHRLRHQAIIERQSWGVPTYRDMEYDQYDTPAATYLIWRDGLGQARGVSRLYPTDRPFMLKDHFSQMANYGEIPQGEKVLEGSRFCIDKNLPVPLRQRIARELIVAYLEYGLAQGIDKIVGIMYPVYWHNLFIKNNWEPHWLGDIAVTPDGMKSRAGYVYVNDESLNAVREKTRLYASILSYGVRYDHNEVNLPTGETRAA